MAVQSMIRLVLVADPTFAAAIPDAKFFNAGAIQSTPDLTKGKFGVLRFDPVLPGIGPVRRMQFFIYVYDRLGTYSAILSVLERAKTVLEGIVGMNHGNGHINQIVWQGISGQLVDDTWRAAVQFATFEVIYTGT